MSTPQMTASHADVLRIVKRSSFVQSSHWRLNLHNFAKTFELISIVIAINVVIREFSGEDLKQLVHVTVRLQVSHYSNCPYTLSDKDFCKLIRVKYSCLCTNRNRRYGCSLLMFAAVTCEIPSSKRDEKFHVFLFAHLCISGVPECRRCAGGPHTLENLVTRRSQNF